MAEVASIQITDIVSLVVTDGTTPSTYKGIREAQVQINTAELVPYRDEGLKYPTEIHETATDELPVVARIRSAAINQLLTLLGLAATFSTVIITGKVNSGGANQVVTLSNCTFRRPRGSFNVNPTQFSELDLEIVASSADGSALPITIEDAA